MMLDHFNGCFGMMPHQMQSLFPLMRKTVKVKTVIMVDTNDEDEFDFVDEDARSLGLTGADQESLWILWG